MEEALAWTKSSLSRCRPSQCQHKRKLLSLFIWPGGIMTVADQADIAAASCMATALDRARVACMAERIAVEMATDALVEIRELLLSEMRANTTASLEVFADLETVRERVTAIENALHAQRRLERLRAREANDAAAAAVSPSKKQRCAIV